MATTTTIVKLQFGKSALMQPMRSKEIVRRWLVAQLEDVDIPQFSVHDNLRKVLLLRGGYVMDIFFHDLEFTFVHERMVPHFKELAGGGGAVHCLSEEEVCQRIVKDMTYTNVREGKAAVVGDLATAGAIVTRALALQGDPSSTVHRNKKRIAQQAIAVFRTSQLVASHKMRKR